MYKTFTRFLYGPEYLWRKLSQLLSGADAAFNKQLIMNMKLTGVLIIIMTMRVSAISFAQQVTLKSGRMSVGDVFKEIRKQTGYNFLLSADNFDVGSTVRVDFNKAPLTTVLDQVLKDKPVSYSIEKKTILIMAKPKSLLERLTDLISQIRVRGKVIDETGQPLPGATVRLRSGTQSTITGAAGDFVLQNVDGSDSLIITFLGYRELRLAVRPEMGSIALTLNNEALSEVSVSSGYQSMLKERAPGAYDLVDQEVLSRRPVSNISTALQGMVAGMQAKENSDGSVNFLIRGNTSLLADRSPLVIVDGFPLNTSDFSAINPNDIQNVTVLKDAAAASIWGARSANGVIVITTKKAGNTKRGLTIDAGVFTRISSKTDLDQVLNTATSGQQVAYERMGYQNRWTYLTGDFTNSFPSDLSRTLTLAQELLYNEKYGRITTDAMNRGLDSLSRIDNHEQIGDLLLRRAVLTQYNVNLSLVSDQARTYASLLFEDNNTRYQATGYNKYGINLNHEYRLTKFLTFNFGTYLQYNKQENSGASLAELQQLSPYETLLDAGGGYSANLAPNTEASASGSNTLTGRNRAILSALPLSIFPYSDWNYNLLREVRGRKLKTDAYYARIQTGLNVKLLPGLSLDSKLQYERGKSDADSYYSDDTYYVRDMVNSTLEYNNGTRAIGRVFLPKGGINQSSRADVANYVFRNQLSFVRDFNTRHSINAIAGTEISQYRTDSRTNPWLYGYYPDKQQSTVPVYGYGSTSDLFTNMVGTSTTLSGGTTSLSYELNRYISYYGNAAYTYDQRYTLSASIRYDASNYITKIPSLRWEPLWSVGGIWNVRREHFASDISWMDRLNVRLTYGRNGSAYKSTSTSPLLTVSTSPNAVTGTITATISDNGNPTLRWEKTSTTNLGADFVFFNGKLSGKLDLYNKAGTDITGQVALAAANGTTSQRFNNAGITNRGIEVQLGTRLTIPATGVTYSTSFNYAYNKNVVNDLYNPALTAGGMLNTAGAYVQGKPVNPVYSYTYLGTVDGIPQVAGPNGQPYAMTTLTLNSGLGAQYLNYEGTATPPHTAGWYNTFAYRNFSLSLLLIGKFGGVYRNGTINYNSASIGSAKMVLNGYVSDIFAGSPDIPGFPAQNDNQFFYWNFYVPYLSGLVENSSYIECKEVMLDYSLPASLTARTSLRRLKVFAQARDLGLIWTANKHAYNPDWLPGTDRPSGTFTLGISAGF